MPNKRNSRNNDSGSRESRPPITDTHEQSSGIAIDDSLVLHLIEALKDDRVMRALHTDSDKLHDKIDSLTVLVANLTTQLENKEQRITELEKPVALLEVSIDDQQQYSRRANLRFTGIEENAGEDTTKKVLQILNETMQLEPPISLDQIERSHRLGRVTPDQRRPRTLIMRFRSERSRDTVYKARGQLKEFNHRSDPIKRIFAASEASIDLHTFTSSSYYDHNLFNKLTQAHKQQFSIMSSNIQSINAKIDELKAFVIEMEQLNFQFDAICLQETWLDDTQDTSLIQLDNYTCITQSKSSSSKGRLLIYLNNKTIVTPNHSTDWENQLIKITCVILHNKSLLLGNIYRPPNDLNYKYDQFTNEFSELQSSLENINSDVVLAGDFNLDLLKINARTSFSNFLDTVISHSFYPPNYAPDKIVGEERNADR